MGAIFQLFRDLGPTRLAAIGGIIVAFIIGIIIISMRLSTPPMGLLYSDLDMKDSSQIVASLEAKNVPYEIRANGTQILVPQDRILRLRMNMAQEGLPSKGSIVGYEIFDQAETLGTSNFVQNVNLLRALEGELARTISAFSQISGARVHLVIPKRELFTRDQQQPSASVVLQIKGSMTLNKEEVNAIGHLVATAVPGLDIARITIVDTKGKPLKLGEFESDEPGAATGNAQEYRISFETRLKRTIEELLEKSLGAGRVQAQVSAELNFDRIVTNSEIYDPEGQVVRSVQTVEEKEATADKAANANVSAANNLPDAQANQGGGGSQATANSSRIDETTNYEISKTIKNHISEAGTIKRLSIAVLVDGYYVTDEKTGKMAYTPRTEEELKKLESLVKSAVGFDAARKDSFEIVNMQFLSNLEGLHEETPMDWLKREFHSLAQTLIVGIVVILAILLVVKPIVARAFEITRADMENPDMAQANLLSSTSALDKSLATTEEEENEVLIDIDQIAVRVKSSSVKSMNDIISKYPEETVAVIRTWMNKD